MNEEYKDKGPESRRRFRWSAALRGYLDLTRLPNVFTAVADVTMGFLIARPVGNAWQPNAWDFWTWAMLAAASAMLYSSGMALNDLFDVEHDRQARPERPLPSGRVSIDAARRLGWTLLWGGVAMGAAAGLPFDTLRPGLVAALLATAILLYDGWLKRTPLGPPAMGACRTLNVMLGVNASNVSLGPGFWLAAGAIGVYAAGITWFARRESQRGNRGQLIAATAVIASGIAMLYWFPRVSHRTMPELLDDPQRWFLLIGIIGLLIVWRCVRAAIDPAPVKVRMAVAQCIMSIVVLDAIACLAVRGVFWAGLIVLLIVPTVLFARAIDVT
ncbi:MAG: UbiA family prenyltransferase [Pirellulales bacterium]|nr:UbiA family prenyltransferase [Pirellulales bacterium]